MLLIVQLCKAHSEGKVRFEINEKEAKIVRKLFAWVVQERVTLREAVQRLKEIRIITPKGKRDSHPSAISRILKNPAYKGQTAFGKTKVGPIKKEVTWEMRKKTIPYIIMTEKIGFI